MDHRLNDKLYKISQRLRSKLVSALYHAQSGHPGSSLSIVELITTLYFHEMNLKGSDRDWCVLSKGHAVVTLYAAFCELGWISEKELKTFRKINSRLQGHPDRTRLPFLDAGTGALGQGGSIAIGYALGAQMRQTSGRAYCIIGDGELQEGQIWEAAMFAGSRRMDNLVFIVDNNKFQNEDWVEKTLPFGSIEDKWTAFGWHVIQCNGHDIGEILTAFDTARKTKKKPTMIIANTIKGKGISFMENRIEWHASMSRP